MIIAAGCRPIETCSTSAGRIIWLINEVVAAVALLVAIIGGVRIRRPRACRWRPERCVRHGAGRSREHLGVTDRAGLLTQTRCHDVHRSEARSLTCAAVAQTRAEGRNFLLGRAVVERPQAAFQVRGRKNERAAVLFALGHKSVGATVTTRARDGLHL
jgi:hypothetical protein